MKKENSESLRDFEVLDIMSKVIRIVSLEIKIEDQEFIFEVSMEDDGDYFVVLIEGDVDYLKSKGESFSGSTYEDQNHMNNSDFTDSLFDAIIEDDNSKL
jgi:hypothetical protein